MRPNGEVLTSGEDIKQEAEDFLKKFLTHKPLDYQGMFIEELQEKLAFRCSDVYKANFTKEVTDEEIQKVLFSMPNKKSPDPDGFTSEFFKVSWNIIGKHFLIAIKSLFEKGFLPKKR